MKAARKSSSSKRSNVVRDFKLDGGKVVQLTEAQIQLYKLCQHLGKLPRELAEQALRNHPKPVLLALKWVPELRSLAFELAHANLELSSTDKVVKSALMVAALGSAVRKLDYDGHRTPNYDFLAEALVPESFPALREFAFWNCRGNAPMTQMQAANILSRLSALPHLEKLSIYNGARNVLAEIDPSGPIVWSTKQIKIGPWFPSLQTLKLVCATPDITDFILYRERPLRSLKRLFLSDSTGPISERAFPSGLVALSIAGCPELGHRDLLEYVRKSSSTLESLHYEDEGKRGGGLDFVAAPVLLPRLKVLAVTDERPSCTNHLRRHMTSAERAASAVVPYWARTSLGFQSRLIAPAVRTLGIGNFLAQPWTDSFGSLVDMWRDTEVVSILCRHVVPRAPDALGEPQTAAEAHNFRRQSLLHQNYEAAVDFLRDTKMQFLCIGEQEYEEYFEDAFSGKVAA